MQTVELVVFIGIAVIVGGLIIGFIAGIDTEGLYDSMKRIFLLEETARYANVDADEFASAAYSAWRECGYGQRDHERIVSLRGEEEVTKEKMFQWYTKFNLCHSIQSAYHECGNREDIEMPDSITPPALIRIACNATQEILEITTE